MAATSTTDTLTPQLEELRKTALANLKNAYNGYSNFAVSAALVDKDGNVYAGVNVENASFPCGWCAEVSAFGAAITAGAREFTGLAVAVDREQFVGPCGRCRQVISEFCYGRNMPIILVNRKGEFQLTRIEEIYGMPFSKENIN